MRVVVNSWAGGVAVDSWARGVAVRGLMGLTHGRIGVARESLIVNVSWVNGSRGFKLGKERLAYSRNCVTGNSLVIVGSCVGEGMRLNVGR